MTVDNESGCLKQERQILHRCSLFLNSHVDGGDDDDDDNYYDANNWNSDDDAGDYDDDDPVSTVMNAITKTVQNNETTLATL